MFKRLAKFTGVLIAALTLTALVVFLLPPWLGRWAYMAHAHTHIPYAFGWPPRHFTGVWRDYGRDGSFEELYYRNGKRDGAQRYFDATGKLARACEFKDGMPWSGLCDFWKFKPWLAEYRDGRVWKGAMQEYDDAQQDNVMKYHFEGKLYTESEFRRLMGFGEDGALIGVMCVRSRPR